MKKEMKKKAFITIVGAIVVIWLLLYLLYQSKFWFGLAGVATLPLLIAAFLIDADVF